MRWMFLHTTEPGGDVSPLGLAPRVEFLVFEAVVEVPRTGRAVFANGAGLGVLACAGTPSS